MKQNYLDKIFNSQVKCFSCNSIVVRDSNKYEVFFSCKCNNIKCYKYNENDWMCVMHITYYNEGYYLSYDFEENETCIFNLGNEIIRVNNFCPFNKNTKQLELTIKTHLLLK